MPGCPAHPASAATLKLLRSAVAVGMRLVGLSSNRCPECGREFDLANRRSYARRPPRGWLRRWGWRVAGMLLLFVLLCGLAFGWLWWGWHSEQKTITQLQEYRAMITAMPTGPKWLGKVLGNRLGYLRERVSELYIHDLSAAQMDRIDFGAGSS